MIASTGKTLAAILGSRTAVTEGVDTRVADSLLCNALLR